MKKIILLTLLFAYSFAYSWNSFSQEIATDSTKKQTLAPDSVALDTTWRITGAANFTFSNVGLNNWVGGGQSAIAVGTISNLKLKRETEKSIWVTQFLLQFGMARNGKSSLNLFKKTDDNLQIQSQWGYKLSKKWNLAGSFQFRSQMANGYLYIRDSEGKEQRDKLLSRIFAPAYLQTGVGIAFDSKYFSMKYAPLASKTTLVWEDSLSAVGAFGVEAGKRSRQEICTNLDLAFQYSPMENVQFSTKLGIFGNYQTLTQLDVNWETLLTFKVNKYLSTSFSTQLLYDHDVLIPQDDGSQKRAIQFKHVLNLNVGYAF
ncbi:DUF3078 domain-containing protein [Hugenholtzia roseola]|uniref:DUF3078 domain-containing protein n=1 Tax=Hugenholtzia roseola TaxID=1002 RepID=UPI0004076BF4|nr:DUF3078 domain-containing protein [Hugenholtzia roseola]